MYKGKKIGVVVPAYNEEKFIASVINTIPDFVDKLYVVKDVEISRRLYKGQTIEEIFERASKQWAVFWESPVLP